MFVSRQLSSEQLLTKWEKRRALQNLMVRFFSEDYLMRRENKMYDTYWSKAADVCLGVNNGYYQGADAVKGYYKGLEERTKLESALIQKKYPQRLGSLSEEEVYGAGVMDMKSLVAPVIEIAGDDATAKGIWTIHGMNTKLTTGGQVSYWERAYVAVDFVWEDEQWKVWHLLYVQDLDAPSGYDWVAPAPEYPVDPAFAEVAGFQFPEPNVKMTVYETYSANRPFYAPPAYPEPYETFAETFSYGL
jgi:hypothetical protein